MQQIFVPATEFVLVVGAESAPQMQAAVGQAALPLGGSLSKVVLELDSG